MFCTNCGTKIVEGKPLCITCGQAVPAASASESAAGPAVDEPETAAKESNLAEGFERPALVDQTVPVAQPGQEPPYCRHSPSERTALGVDRQHGSEICMGCKLPYLPGSPNSRLRAGDQLGMAPPPEVGAVSPSGGGGGVTQVYRRSSETVRPKPNTQIEAKGFFSGLFDFGFTSFITLKFLRVIYGVLVVLILLMGVGLLVASISQGGLYAVLAIVVVPIVTLIYLVVTRVSLEIVALFFRIGENTTLMVAAAERDSLRSGLAGPYPAQTSPPSGPPPSGSPVL
jgi:Domain of unknown function (DUF4282)